MFNIKEDFEKIKKIINLEQFEAITELKEYILLTFEIYESNYKFQTNDNEFYNLKNLLIKESELVKKLNNLNLANYSNEASNLIQDFLYNKNNDEKFEASKEFELKKIDLNIVFANLIKYFSKISEDMNLPKENINLILNDYLKLNTIPTIDNNQLNNFITGTNIFTNLPKEEQEFFLKEFKSIGKYTSISEEKRLIAPAEKILNKEIDMGISQEAKAWISLLLKVSKDHSNVLLKDELKKITETNNSIIEPKTIKEIEKALSSANFAKILDVNFHLPDKLNEFALDYVIMQIDKLSNVIDVINSMDAKKIAEYASKGFENLTDLVDTLSNGSVSLTTIKTIFGLLPESYKEQIPGYTKLKKELDDLNQLVSKKISDTIHIEEIKKSLNSCLGVLGHTKDDLLKNLNNLNTNSMVTIMTRVGNQYYSTHTEKILLKINNFDNYKLDKEKKLSTVFKNILKKESDDPKLIIKSLEKLDKDKFDELILSIQNFDTFTKELTYEDIKHKLLTNKSYYNDLINGKEFLIYLEEKLNKDELNTLNQIREGIIPNTEDCFKLLENEFLNTYYFKFKENIENVLKDYIFKQDEINFDFHRATFLNTLSNQINDATVPTYKKNYYLDSFISINKDDASIVLSKNPLEDLQKKQKLLDLSLEDLEKSINENENNKVIKEKLEKSKETLKILKDIVQINSLINSGDIMFLDIDQNNIEKSISKLLYDRFNYKYYFETDHNDSIIIQKGGWFKEKQEIDNYYIQNLRNVFINKVIELTNSVKEQNFKNNSLNKKEIDYTSKEKFGKEIIEKKLKDKKTIEELTYEEINVILRNINAPDNIKHLGIDKLSLFNIVNNNVKEFLENDENYLIKTIAEDKYELNQYFEYKLGENHKLEILDPRLNIKIKEIIKKLVDNPNILLEQLSYNFDFYEKIGCANEQEANYSYSGVKGYSNEILFLNFLNQAKDFNNKGFIDNIIDDYLKNSIVNKNKGNAKIDDLDIYIQKLMYITNYDRKKLIDIFPNNINNLEVLSKDDENLEKFMKQTNNQLLEKLILHSIEKNDKNINFDIEKKAFKLISKFNEQFGQNEFYTEDKINKKLEWEREKQLSSFNPIDYYYSLYGSISVANMDNNKILDLFCFSKEDLLLLNQSTFAKKYLLDNFSTSMNNPLDHNILEHMKNGTLDVSLKNKNNDELNKLRVEFNAYELTTLYFEEYNFNNDESINFMGDSHIQEKTYFGLPKFQNNGNIYELVYKAFDDYLFDLKDINDLNNIIIEKKDFCLSFNEEKELIRDLNND